MHRQGRVAHEEHGPEGILIEGRIPTRLVAALQPYAVETKV